MRFPFGASGLVSNPLPAAISAQHGADSAAQHAMLRLQVPKGFPRVAHRTMGDIFLAHARPEYAGALFQVRE
jgi:hypothetical protein